MQFEPLYPRQVVLVTAATRERANVTAVEWLTPVSDKPPIIALSLLNSSLTLELLSSSREFVVAIPGDNLKDATMLCGTTSGKFIDKFSEASLAQAKARRVSAPLILDAVANLECRVLGYSSAGNHTLVTGEIVEAHLPKDGKSLGALVFDRGGRRLFSLGAEEQKQ